MHQLNDTIHVCCSLRIWVFRRITAETVQRLLRETDIELGKSAVMHGERYHLPETQTLWVLWCLQRLTAALLYSLGTMAILKCPAWQCCSGWPGSASLDHIFVDTFLVWCWDQGLGLPRSCGCHRHLVVLRLVFLLLEVLHAVWVFLRPETGVQICYLCPHHCAKITHWVLVKYLSIEGVVRLLDTFLKTGQSGDLCLQPLSPKVSRQPLGM